MNQKTEIGFKNRLGTGISITRLREYYQRTEIDVRMYVG